MTAAIQTLTAHQLLAAQQEIFNATKLCEAQLLALRATSLPIMEKWQRLLALILPIQFEAIASLGLARDQPSLMAFNEQIIKASERDRALADLAKQRWLFIFEKAFGLTEFSHVSLDKVRALMADMV